jgi:hypothetical protein
VYKVGTWLKHRHTSDLLEIVGKKWHKQGFYVYFIINHNIPGQIAYEWYDNEINNLTDVSVAARLLYSNKLTSNQGVQNETNEKQIWFNNQRG